MIAPQPISNTPDPAKGTYPVHNLEEIKQKVLNWTQSFSTFCLLDNHHYPGAHHSVECLLAAGVKRFVSAPAGTALEQLDAFQKASEGRWLFGHLGYDLKAETAGLPSSFPDPVGFADLFFFEPEVLLHLSEGQLVIEAENPQAVYSAILQSPSGIRRVHQLVDVQCRFTRDAYLEVIRSLQAHILRGDCYEINFCIEFFSQQAKTDPLAVYQQLSRLSPNPFSALYRVKDQWLICASPERFLKKEGNRILSQPIKGTSKREPGDPEADLLRRKALYQSSKDRSENVMVVDLVRNDLSRVCVEGTVQVDELYGIYSFPQVHQMISTVSGELRPGISLAEIIHACFPMGSMTGAPKQRVMELIGSFEKSKRGIFSGALGYIDPNGNFDFNVVIRSIMYNALSGYLSFQAGSGITFYSDAEQEWEECRLKAAAMRKVLEGS